MLYLKFMHLCISTLIFMYLGRVKFKFFSSHQGSSLVDFFSHVRTANLNISFKHVESIYFHLRRVNFRRLSDNEGDKLALSQNLSCPKGECI